MILFTNPGLRLIFYRKYRDVINSMKKNVSDTLSPSNAAFCGFLMMCMETDR